MKKSQPETTAERLCTCDVLDQASETVSARCALHKGGQTDENRTLITKIRILQTSGEPEGAAMGRVLGGTWGAGSIQTGPGGGHQVVVLNFIAADYFFYMLTTVYNFDKFCFWGRGGLVPGIALGLLGTF